MAHKLEPMVRTQTRKTLPSVLLPLLLIADTRAILEAFTGSKDERPSP